jgi:hypothetical protein
MQVIGFNFTKMSAEKMQKLIKNPSTHIEFIDLESEKIDLLKDNEAVKVFFTYDLLYGEGKDTKKEDSDAVVSFHGNISLSVSKDEFKEITNSWKDKRLPSDMNVFLFNLILRRCTPKAVHLQDEIGLPFHVPMPKLTPKQTEPEA